MFKFVANDEVLCVEMTWSVLVALTLHSYQRHNFPSCVPYRIQLCSPPNAHTLALTHRKAYQIQNQQSPPIIKILSISPSLFLSSSCGCERDKRRENEASALELNSDDGKKLVVFKQGKDTQLTSAQKPKWKKVFLSSQDDASNNFSRAITIWSGKYCTRVKRTHFEEVPSLFFLSSRYSKREAANELWDERYVAAWAIIEPEIYEVRRNS